MNKKIMITTINEFRKINEQNTDVAQAVWQFYKPEERKKFLGSESGSVNHEFANKEWSELSDGVASTVKNWLNDNPWLYTNLTQKTEWQQYIAART